MQQGADKDKGENRDMTPLFAETQLGNLDAVQYLVQQGADKDQPVGCGITPLAIAVQMGQRAVASYLFEQGAAFTVSIPAVQE